MTFWDNHPWLAVYLVGCAVTFVIGVVYLFIHILAGFSTFGHNLRQVGARVSWTYGTAKEIAEDDMGQNFPSFMLKLGLSTLACAFNSLTSWLAVILIPFMVFWGIIKSIGVPREVRDARWRLKNLKMDFDGVLRNVKAIEGKHEYSHDRTALLNSLRERGLMSEHEFEHLMKVGRDTAAT